MVVASVSPDSARPYKKFSVPSPRMSDSRAEKVNGTSAVHRDVGNIEL